EWIVGHHLSHAGAARVAAFGHHAPHEVAFGENADQFAVVQDWYGADVALNHGSHGFEHGMAQFPLIRVLMLDQVADTHLTPPGVQSSEQSKSIYRGASICRRGDERKAKKGWQERKVSPNRANSDGKLGA